MRTGVRMIWPSRVSTSKYSVAPTTSVTALGSVSWFLEVSLASMEIPASSKVRTSYFTITCTRPALLIVALVHRVAVTLDEIIALRRSQILAHHFRHQFRKAHFRDPTKLG